MCFFCHLVFEIFWIFFWQRLFSLYHFMGGQLNLVGVLLFHSSFLARHGWQSATRGNQPSETVTVWAIRHLFSPFVCEGFEKGSGFSSAPQLHHNNHNNLQAFLRLSFFPVSFGSFPAMETGISQRPTALALAPICPSTTYTCTTCAWYPSTTSPSPHARHCACHPCHRPFRRTFPPAWQEQIWSVWGLHVIQRSLEVQSDVAQWHWL